MTFWASRRVSGTACDFRELDSGRSAGEENVRMNDTIYKGIFSLRVPWTDGGMPRRRLDDERGMRAAARSGIRGSYSGRAQGDINNASPESAA